jgi:hypothetical protein
MYFDGESRVKPPKKISRGPRLVDANLFGEEGLPIHIAQFNDVVIPQLCWAAAHLVTQKYPKVSSLKVTNNLSILSNRSTAIVLDVSRQIDWRSFSFRFCTTS